MSFWDRIKPSTRPPQVTQAALADGGLRLELTWDDGREGPVPARALRQECPCAACVDEWTNQRTLDPAKVAEDVRVEEVQPVGNYALAFRFSDGHATGIYPWALLRALSVREA